MRGSAMARIIVHGNPSNDSFDTNDSMSISQSCHICLYMTVLILVYNPRNVWLQTRLISSHAINVCRLQVGKIAKSNLPRVSRMIS